MQGMRPQELLGLEPRLISLRTALPSPWSRCNPGTASNAIRGRNAPVRKKRMIQQLFAIITRKSPENQWFSGLVVEISGIEPRKL